MSVPKHTNCPILSPRPASSPFAPDLLDLRVTMDSIPASCLVGAWTFSLPPTSDPPDYSSATLGSQPPAPLVLTEKGLVLTERKGLGPPCSAEIALCTLLILVRESQPPMGVLSRWVLVTPRRLWTASFRAQDSSGLGWWLERECLVRRIDLVRG